MAAVSPPGADGRLRPNEVKQIFEVAETSQGLLDAFFRVCSDYFPACVLLFFVGDDAIVRRTHGRSSSAVAIGARFSQDLSGALGPLRGGGELGAAAVTVEPNDALVVCGACTPGDALLLPLVVRSRTAAAVLGDSTISDADRRDLLSITTMASTALQSIIVRRSTSAAAVSEATRIMSAPIQEEEIAAERRRRMALVISAATAGVVLVGALYFVFGGLRGPTVVPLADIPGEPRVDVAALVPLARKASGLGDSADSASLRATVAPDGTTNLLEPGLGAESMACAHRRRRGQRRCRARGRSRGHVSATGPRSGDGRRDVWRLRMRRTGSDTAMRRLEDRRCGSRRRARRHRARRRDVCILQVRGTPVDRGDPGAR